MAPIEHPRIRPVLLIALVAAIALSAAAGAQPVIKVTGFVSDELSRGELDALERMVRSCVAEERLFSVVDEAQLDDDDAERRSDFILTGGVLSLGGRYAFTLEIINARTGEKRSARATFANVNEVALNARALTLRLLRREEAPRTVERGESAIRDGSPLVLSMVVGTWKGDRGIDSVVIGKDGGALASLSSGATMRLRVFVADGRFIVEQDQPNSPLFYASPSYSAETAREIALRARAMRWVFTLSDNGATLSGIKETTAVSGGQGPLVVDNGYVRPASWTRLYR